MSYEDLTREELISELRELRRRVAMSDKSMDKRSSAEISVRNVEPKTVYSALLLGSEAFRRMFKEHGAVCT